LVDVGLLAAFHLHRHLARTEQTGRDTGEIRDLGGGAPCLADRGALDEMLLAAGVEDHLRKRDLAVGGKRDLEGGRPAGRLADDLGRQLDAKDA
jgi:hypothetical protein